MSAALWADLRQNIDGAAAHADDCSEAHKEGSQRRDATGMLFLTLHKLDKGGALPSAATWADLRQNLHRARELNENWYEAQKEGKPRKTAKAARKRDAAIYWLIAALRKLDKEGALPPPAEVQP